MASLYELTDEYLRFNDYMEEILNLDQEFTEEQLETFVDTLDGIQESIEDKGGKLAAYMKSLKAEAEMFKVEEEKLAKKRKARENTYDRLKQYAFDMLTKVGKDKIQSGVHGFRIQKSNPSVEILDETKIPKEYKISQPDKVDKKAILADLKNEKEIVGAKLIKDKKHVVIL